MMNRYLILLIILCSSINNVSAELHVKSAKLNDIFLPKKEINFKLKLGPSKQKISEVSSSCGCIKVKLSNLNDSTDQEGNVDLTGYLIEKNITDTIKTTVLIKLENEDIYKYNLVWKVIGTISIEKTSNKFEYSESEKIEFIYEIKSLTNLTIENTGKSLTYSLMKKDKINYILKVISNSSKLGSSSHRITLSNDVTTSSLDVQYFVGSSSIFIDQLNLGLIYSDLMVTDILNIKNNKITTIKK